MRCINHHSLFLLSWLLRVLRLFAAAVKLSWQRQLITYGRLPGGERGRPCCCFFPQSRKSYTTTTTLYDKINKLFTLYDKKMLWFLRSRRRVNVSRVPAKKFIPHC
jgi:hypothetical protein